MERHAVEIGANWEEKCDSVVAFRPNLRGLIDPRYDSPKLRDLYTQVLHKLGQFNRTKREEIIEEAKKFTSAPRTHLRDSEVICLMVAHALSASDQPVGAGDVLLFAQRMERPLSDATVFKAFSELNALGLLKKYPEKVTTDSGRLREVYNLTSFGIVALNIAVIYAKHLHESREQMAA